MSAPRTQDTFNIAGYLPAMADRFPHQAAVVMPEDHNDLGRRRYSHLTFRQLDALCDAYAHGLVDVGFRRGDRVLLLVSQGLELIALTFALFKIGAAPILIDPGMGRDSFLRCIEHSEPRCLIGIPRAFVARALFRKPFRSVEVAVCTRPRWYAFGAHGLPDLARHDAGPFEARPTSRDDRAAILFTSGSTGPAKGVLYTHGIFDGQVQSIRDMYDIEPGEVAVPAFPLFALFSVAMGMTCVIPDFDPAAPAECNPAYLVEAIEDFGADMAFGSPAIWTIVARYCEQNDITLDSVSRMLMFGAAIPPKLQRRWEAITDGGRVHTPYGATESLPVATISSEEVLAETADLARRGRGICVGRPVDHVTVKIIAIDDGPLETWDEVTVLPDGEIGEITVQGSTVTPGYDRRPEHDALSKISDGDQFWHRMGDLGYFDEQGRLWFCGRKSHRVATAEGPLFTVQCEAIFNEHPAVYRSALIGLGEGDQEIPAIVIEPEPDEFPATPAAEAAFLETMLELAATSELTRRIEHVFLQRDLPVDRRHNAKIHRGELATRYSRTLDTHAT